MTNPNVLLVVLDSVRARNTSLHGHVNDTTPFLASLAAERGTVYEQARAPATWSLPSHASIFTGYHVAEHQFVDRTKALRPAESIWTTLAKSGYTTGLFSSNPYLTELPTGLDAGFETVRGRLDLPFPEALNPREFVQKHGRGEYAAYVKACLDNAQTVRSLLNGLSEKLAEDAPWLLPGAFRSPDHCGTYADAFLDWQADQSGPWAACLNLMDTHTSYDPTTDHDHWGGKRLRELQASMDNQVWEFYGGGRPWWQLGALSSLYDGAIHRVDAELRRIVRELESRGAFEETLLVVTADHGEGFGEQSRIRNEFRIAGHQPRGLEEVLLHVPLVVKRPGQDEANRIEDVATITRFPAVVDAVRNGREEPGEFVPVGPVLTSSYGLDAQKVAVASRYCEDLDPFRESGHAVYRGSGENVTKQVQWGDRHLQIDVFDAMTSVRRSDSDGSSVSSTLAAISPRDILETTETGVAQETRDRLADLGYI